MHTRKRSVRVKQPPPPSRGLAALATSNASEDSRQNSFTQSFRSQDEETFSAGGLLGRTYTTRQRAVQEREHKQNAAFTEGPSLISNMDRLAAQTESGLNRSSSTRSNQHRRTSSDMRRTASKRAPGLPQPLVGLTPQYRPPPQFIKQGKGFNPGAGAGPLVESATSMEEAIQVPSSTDWRARPRPTYGPGTHERTKSLKGRGEPLAAHTFNNHTGAPRMIVKPSLVVCYRKPALVKVMRRLVGVSWTGPRHVAQCWTLGTRNSFSQAVCWRVSQAQMRLSLIGQASSD